MNLVLRRQPHKQSDSRYGLVEAIFFKATRQKQSQKGSIL